MKMLLFCALIGIVCYGGGRKDGIRHEVDLIQQTCEDDSTGTVLNGQTYVCITLEQAVELRKRLKERGA